MKLRRSYSMYIWDYIYIIFCIYYIYDYIYYINKGTELTPDRGQVYASIGVLISWSILNCFRVDRVGIVNTIAGKIHLVLLLLQNI